MKQNNFTAATILAITLSLLIQNVAYASPTISSEESQNFTQNDGSTQLKAITITEDSSQVYIKTGTIKITIPESLAIIFDKTRTKAEILAYGTAVDNGKVKSLPKITFENKDKTIVIPVDKDFDVNEKLVITKVFIEGFYSSPANSERLIMEINGESYSDNASLYIFSNSKEDGNAPDMPIDIKIENLTDGSIKISWTDPTDLDLKSVQILRGKNTEPSGTPYKSILAGTQVFFDKEVSKGDKMQYILRANDGKNYSNQSELLEITVATPTTTTPSTTESTTSSDSTSTDTSTESQSTTSTTSTENTSTPTTPLSATTTCQTFSDITQQDAFCTILKTINQNNIITGYSDGTFKGESQINRAELLKLVLLYANIDIISPAQNEPIFSDVNPDEWYADYIYTAKKLGIIDGYPNGTFMPAQAVNKAEAIKIILKAIKAETGIVSSAPYEDTPVNQNNAWYLPYAQYLKDTVDTNSANFDPSHLMTRREIVEMLNSLGK